MANQRHNETEAKPTLTKVQPASKAPQLDSDPRLRPKISLSFRRTSGLYDGSFAVFSIICFAFLSFAIDHLLLQSRTETAKPQSQIHWNIKQQSKSTTPAIILKGQISPENCQVRYQSKRVKTNEKGQFQIPLTLKQGKNLIKLSATSPNGEKSQFQSTISCDSQAPILIIDKMKYLCDQLHRIQGTVLDSSGVSSLRFLGHELKISETGHFQFTSSQTRPIAAALVATDHFGLSSRAVLQFYQAKSNAKAQIFAWQGINLKSQQTITTQKDLLTIHGQVSKPSEISISKSLAGRLEPILTTQSNHSGFFSLKAQLTHGRHKLILKAKPSHWISKQTPPELKLSTTVICDRHPPRVTLYHLNDQKQLFVSEKNFTLHGYVSDDSPVTIQCGNTKLEKHFGKFAISLNETQRPKDFIRLFCHDAAGNSLSHRVWLRRTQTNPLSADKRPEKDRQTRIKIRSAQAISPQKYDKLFAKAQAFFLRYQNFDGDWNDAWPRNHFEKLPLNNRKLTEKSPVNPIELTCSIILVFLQHGFKPAQNPALVQSIKWLQFKLKKHFAADRKLEPWTATKLALFECALVANCVTNTLTKAQLENYWRTLLKTQQANGSFKIQQPEMSQTRQLKFQCQCLDIVRIAEKLHFDRAKQARKALAQFFASELARVTAQSSNALKCFLCYGVFFSGLPRTNPKSLKLTKTIRNSHLCSRPDQLRRLLAIRYALKDSNWRKDCHSIFQSLELRQITRGPLRGAISKQSSQFSSQIFKDTADSLLALIIFEKQRLSTPKTQESRIPQSLQQQIRRWLTQRTQLECLRCHSTGQIECDRCLGYGRKQRLYLGDNVQSKPCNICHETGQIRCLRCQSRYDALDPQKVFAMFKRYQYFAPFCQSFQEASLNFKALGNGCFLVSVKIRDKNSAQDQQELSLWHRQAHQWRLKKAPTTKN